MEVLNATGLAPFLFHQSSVLPEKRSEPKRPPFPPFLQPTKAFASLATSVGVTSSAQALTYEEALNKTLGSSSEFNLGGFIDEVLKFGSENPFILAGWAAVAAVPFIVSQILGSSKAGRVKSAKNAYAKLAEDADAQLLDIREVKELKLAGSPDLRGLKKKTVAITYRGEDKAGFLKKLALKYKDPGNTTLFILDKFDGNSEEVTELVTANSFKAAFAIKDGAEGAQGWKNSGLPWSPPKRILFVDFGDLRDAIGETSDSIFVTLALAAATGLGLFVFTEIESLLQILGSAAIIQLINKKLLFAENRKVTFQQFDEFLNTKVAPKEFVDEIKTIAKALLPSVSSSQASPPASVSPSNVASFTEMKSEMKELGVLENLNVASFTESKAEKKEEHAQVLTRSVNSVPKTELEEKTAGRLTTLSPYPYYPDFKPPASPSPSKP